MPGRPLSYTTGSGYILISIIFQKHMTM